MSSKTISQFKSGCRQKTGAKCGGRNLSLCARRNVLPELLLQLGKPLKLLLRAHE